jgi:hypothetical protein
MAITWRKKSTGPSRGQFADVQVDPAGGLPYSSWAACAAYSMPAITLGLAEVEERLRALRRRVNSVTAQHSIYLGVSSAILLVAALIIVGLRASASTFRIAACGSVLLVMIIAVACLGYARRRWLDVQHTARLADTRALLTDRLSTLVDLRLRPRSSRLAPVLVSQVLALGAQWQAWQIAPRRVPRSILLLVAALLALAGTLLVERRTPPELPSPTTAEAGKLAALRPAATFDALRNSGVRAGEQPDAAGGLQRPTTLLPPGDFPGRAAGSPGGQGQSWSLSPSLEETKSRPGLTDRLQQTIRHALHGDVPEQSSQIASRSEISSRDDTKSDADRHAKPNGGDRRNDTAPKKADSSGQRKVANSGAPPQTGSDAPQAFQGSSPAAGEGSSPRGLLDPRAAAAGAGRADAKRFKLAISSFLHPVPQQAGHQPRAGGGVGAAERGAGGIDLNERQMADDAMRKAEIPAEYEDLVRRVYSRAEP